MYRQLLHTADISPFDIIVLFFWQAQWARSIISAVLFLFHWVHTLTMVTFLNGSTCALPILYNNLQPILTSVTTSWATWAQNLAIRMGNAQHKRYSTDSDKDSRITRFAEPASVAKCRATSVASSTLCVH